MVAVIHVCKPHRQAAGCPSTHPSRPTTTPPHLCTSCSVWRQPQQVLSQLLLLLWAALTNLGALVFALHTWAGGSERLVLIEATHKLWKGRQAGRQAGRRMILALLFLLCSQVVFRIHDGHERSEK